MMDRSDFDAPPVSVRVREPCPPPDPVEEARTAYERATDRMLTAHRDYNDAVMSYDEALRRYRTALLERPA